MASFCNEKDLETRDIQAATKELEYGPTTSDPIPTATKELEPYGPTTKLADPIPLSTFPEGGWRAWSVVLGVYVYFHLSLRRFTE